MSIMMARLTGSLGNVVSNSMMRRVSSMNQVVTRSNFGTRSVATVKIDKILAKPFVEDSSTGKFVRYLGPGAELDNWDPFLQFEEFHFNKGTDCYPRQACRGFQIFNYVLKGELWHEDSKSNRKVLVANEAQVIVAGKGIIHSEAPIVQGITNGITLWINLPHYAKLIPAEYSVIRFYQLPQRTFDNRTHVAVVSGRSETLNLKSHLEAHKRFNCLDITIHSPFQSYSDMVPVSDYGFLFIVSGSGKIVSDGTEVKAGQCALFSESKRLEEKFQEFTVESGASTTDLNPFRVLVFSSEQLLEPIHRRGTVVMTSPEDAVHGEMDLAEGHLG